MRFLRVFTIFFLLFVSFIISPSQANAATFRQGDTITVTESLKDLYVSGGTVDITGTTQNDLAAAGGTVRLEGDTTNDAFAAGGNITLSGKVGNNARIAGGNIVIQAPITNDLIAAGGTIDITNEASIGADLVVAGGTIRIHAPVKGDIWVTGGSVEIDSSVGGTVHGADVGELRLGPNAVIGGNLDYSAQQKAVLANGATVKGKQNFKQIEREKEHRGNAAGGAAIAGLITAGAIFKLIASILISIFFIWLLPRFLKKTNETIALEPLKTGFLGFATLILMPILSVMLLMFLWLGIASFFLYFFLLIVSAIVVHIFVGWWVLRWWHGRDNKRYELDWKSGVIGPILVTVLWLIPVAGWLINFILWLLALGALMLQLWDFITFNREAKPQRHK